MRAYVVHKGKSIIDSDVDVSLTPISRLIFELSSAKFPYIFIKIFRSIGMCKIKVTKNFGRVKIRPLPEIFSNSASDIKLSSARLYIFTLSIRVGFSNKIFIAA